jgi:hypothetical protein
MTTIVDTFDSPSVAGPATRRRAASRGASALRLRALSLLRLDLSQWALRALTFVSFALVAVRRWWQMGDYPSGLDQGHWLAFGRAYWGHGNSSLTDLVPFSAMPPVVPTLMAGGTALFGAEITSRALATGSLLAVMLATFVLTRSVAHPLVATAIAVLVGTSATVVEPAAWGGYPQNLALSVMVVALLLVSRYLSEPSFRLLVGYGLACLGVAATHHAYFAIGMTAVAAVVITWASARPGWSPSRRRIGAVILASVPGGALFGGVALSLLSAHYSPAIDASGSPIVVSLEFAFPTVRWLWIAVGLIGAAALVARGFRSEHASEWRVAFVLVVVAVAGFTITGEPRMLPPLVVGAATGLAWALHALGRRVATAAETTTALAAALIVLGLAWPSTDQKAQIAFNYYRVLSPSLLEAARFIDSDPVPGSAAVRTDARGWPVGWWFRGLTDRPVLVGSDEKWLGFEEEQRQAVLVNRLFNDSSSPEEVRSRAVEAGIDLLVFRPRDMIKWEGWSFDHGDPLVRVYDDGEYLVLAVRADP